MTTKAGLYIIKNKITGGFYCGSSVNMSVRWSNHKQSAKKGSKKSPHLYNAIRKYGIDNFEIYPLLICSTEHLELYEQNWLNKNYGKYNCYNASPNAIAPWRGRKMSMEMRKRLSKSMMGRIPWNKGTPRTDEEKYNIREATLKKTPLAIQETEWDNIKELYFTSKHTIKEIANKYNVSSITIQKILKRFPEYEFVERRGGWNKGISHLTNRDNI